MDFRTFFTVEPLLNKKAKDSIELAKLKAEKDAKKIERRNAKLEKRNEAKQRAKEVMELNKFYEDWVKILSYIGIKNSLDQTFALRNMKWESFGITCEIHSPYGVTLNELDKEDNIAKIQEALKCLFLIKRIPKSNKAEAKFITRDIPLVNFEPVKLKPHITYLSTGIDGKPITSDMMKYPHIIIQGATNQGKTKFIDSIITNFIATEGAEDLSLYIIQADKSDQIRYRKCKHCQGYVEKLEDMYGMLKYLLYIVEKRNEQLKPLIEDGIAENISEFNKAAAKKKLKLTKWKYIYLVIDEYSSLMPEGESNKDRKTIKTMIQSMMERILQIGRSVGLFVILSTQRATVDKMPSFVKAMCCTIVSFRVNNTKSSEVALDCTDAARLKQREFIVKVEDMVFGRTANLTSRDINEIIKPFKLIENSAGNTGFSQFNDLDKILNSNNKKPRATKEERRKKKEELGIEPKISKAKVKAPKK